MLCIIPSGDQKKQQAVCNGVLSFPPSIEKERQIGGLKDAEWIKKALSITEN